MGKKIRIFEKRADGGLIEVGPEVRETRRVSRVNLDIDVLWTAEEEAERNAEEAKAEEDRAQVELASKQAKQALSDKLATMGLSLDELKQAFEI